MQLDEGHSSNVSDLQPKMTHFASFVASSHINIAESAKRMTALRGGNKLIMKEFQRAGARGTELKNLNAMRVAPTSNCAVQCRCHHHQQETVTGRCVGTSEKQQTQGEMPLAKNPRPKVSTQGLSSCVEATPSPSLLHTRKLHCELKAK